MHSTEDIFKDIHMRYIIIKLSKGIDKGRYLKEAREKQLIMYK